MPPANPPPSASPSGDQPPRPPVALVGAGLPDLQVRLIAAKPYADRLGLGDLDTMREIVTHSLERSFFGLRCQLASNAEQRYLAAMAALGDPPHRTREAATRSAERTSEGGSVFRDPLIQKGFRLFLRIGSQIPTCSAGTAPHYGAFSSKRGRGERSAGRPARDAVLVRLGRGGVHGEAEQAAYSGRGVCRPRA